MQCTVTFMHHFLMHGVHSDVMVLRWGQPLLFALHIIIVVNSSKFFFVVFLFCLFSVLFLHHEKLRNEDMYDCWSGIDDFLSPCNLVQILSLIKMIL